MAQRYEVLKIDAIEKIEKTPEGFLRLPARVTRSGVFVYRKADGTLKKEFRSPEEVFNLDSLSSLLAKPVTNNHPKEGKVDSGNAKQHTIGFTSDSIQEDGKFVKIFLNILDEDAIQDIKHGKRELSCGYTCKVTDENGESNGEKYDSFQTNIHYNHVALVHRGRAGTNVRLSLDSDDAVLESAQGYRVRDDTSTVCADEKLISTPKTKKKEEKMEYETIKIDEKDVEVSKKDIPTVTHFINGQLSKVLGLEKKLKDTEELKSDLDNTETLLDKANGKIKGYKATVSELEKKLNKFDDRVKEAALERANLKKIADSILAIKLLEKIDSLS